MPIGLNAQGISLLFVSDARYFHGLILSIATVLRYSTGLDQAHVHVLDGGLKKWQRRALAQLVKRSGHGMTLAFHKLDAQRFSKSARLGDSTCTYGRMLAPEIFPALSEILYVDCDIYYGLDVREIWSVDVSRYAVAAVLDACCPTLVGDCPWLADSSPDASLPYFNAGVLKMNLNYWRKNNITARAVAIAQNEPENCRFWDQTILNYLLRNAVTWLPGNCNTLERCSHAEGKTDDALRRINVHFVSHRKPWLEHSSRPAFVMWRQQYAALVSKWPSYMFNFRYWHAFTVEEKMVSSGFGVLVPRALQSSFIYRGLAWAVGLLRQWRAR